MRRASLAPPLPPSRSSAGADGDRCSSPWPPPGPARPPVRRPDRARSPARDPRPEPERRSPQRHLAHPRPRRSSRSSGQDGRRRRRARRGRPAEATLALRDLFLARPSLDRADGVAADRLLARPTDGASDPYGDGYSDLVDQALRQARVRPLGALRAPTRRPATRGPRRTSPSWSRCGAPHRLARLPQAGPRRLAGRQRQVRRLPQGDRRTGASTATARPSSASAGSASRPPASACSTTTSPRASSAGHRSRACGSPPPTSSSTPSSSPTTSPRTPGSWSRRPPGWRSASPTTSTTTAPT